MQTLIPQYAQAEYDAGDDAAVVAKLNAASIEVRDDDQYTWAGIALVAGPEAAEMLRVQLDANNMGWAVHQFGGTGLQLTNPLVKGAIEQFIALGVPLQPLLDHVIQTVSPAVQVLGRDATLSDVSEYRTEQRRQQVREAGAGQYNAWVSAVDAWDGQGDAPAASLGGA